MAKQSYMTLDPNEEVVHVYHRHIISYIPIVVATAIVLAVSFFAEAWLTANTAIFSSIVSASTITMVIMLLDLLMILVAVAAFFIFRQNRLILTNIHLIEITQSGLFGRELSKFSLDELQDAKGTRQGVLPTLLNYGEVLIQTAGERDNFLFRPVGSPLEAAEAINDMHESFERAHTYIRP